MRTRTEPVLLRSRLLEGVGVPHAFSTRLGGVSSGEGGVFESLNFGNPGDLAVDRRDPAANIRANWAAVFSAIGTGGRELVEVHQVHGAAVRVVHAAGPAHENSDGSAAGDGGDTKADAIVTDDPKRVIAVRVADCCPVLLASRDGRAVGTVHAGWRGVVQNIAGASVHAMIESFGLRPRELVAAIGPCIGADAFEVGPEVAAEFERVFGVGTPVVRPGAAAEKSMIDMKTGLREQLIASGLTPDAIDVLPHCTVSSVDDLGKPMFFSHRRDRGVTGRMVGIIGVR